MGLAIKVASRKMVLVVIVLQLLRSVLVDIGLPHIAVRPLLSGALSLVVPFRFAVGVFDIGRQKVSLTVGVRLGVVRTVLVLLGVVTHLESISTQSDLPDDNLQPQTIS